MNKDIQNKLNDREKKVTTKLGLRKTIKLAEYMNKLNTNLCEDCKKVFAKTRGKADPKDYCEACEFQAQKFHDKIRDLCK